MSGMNPCAEISLGIHTRMRRSIPIYEDDYGRVELVQHMGSDQTIIDAARVSFAQDLESDIVNVLGEGLRCEGRWRPENDPKLLRYLIKNQHWSPLEHCVITWHIVVPLFVRGQWHRHRTWSYNEVSRRYTSEDIRFYEPNRFRPQAPKNKQASVWAPEEAINPDVTNAASGLVQSSSFVMNDWCRRSLALYNNFIDAGVAREQARMVLPQNMYVRFYGTVNLRNAMAFIKLREDNHAQWEIYKAAQAMREHLEHLYPETMKAWDEVK